MTRDDRGAPGGRGADGQALQDDFEAIVAPFRREPHAHCYRMLGSCHDADDALQEALSRAWRTAGAFRVDSPVRTWLSPIPTNTCLDELDRRGRRWLPVDPSPGADATRSAGSSRGRPRRTVRHLLRRVPGTRRARTCSSPSSRRCQLLSPRQRAALVPRDVLAFSARETAEVLDSSVAAANSAVQHARTRLRAAGPRRTQQETLARLGDARVRRIVEASVTALEQRDVTAFLNEGPLTVRWRHLLTEANGQPAVACYRWDSRTHRYEASVLDVLGLEHDRISIFTAFVDPALFDRFGLPEHLPAPPEPGTGP